RLTSSTTVGVVAALIVLAVTGFFLLRFARQAQENAAREAQKTRLEAAAALRQLGDDLKTIQTLLSTPDAEPRQREEGLALGQRHLERYRILETPSWQEAPVVQALSAEEKQRLLEDMSELLLLLARATARQAESASDAAARQEQLAHALRLN